MMALADQLRGVLGNDARDIVADDPVTLEGNGGDKWFASHPPEAVVFARSAEQVSRVLRFANEHAVPVTARGAADAFRRGAALSFHWRG